MKRLVGLFGLCVVWIGCVAQGPGGEGLIPKQYDGSLVIAPSPAAFDDVRVGCVGSVSLDLVNASPDLPIEITNVLLPSDVYTLSEPLPIALEPGERRTIALHFSPDAPGARAGNATLVTDEGRLHPAKLPLRARAHPRSEVPIDPAALEPLDLVFVLDVSTSMNEIAALRTSIARAFDRIDAEGFDARFGLSTFANDVRIHADAGFLEREAFFVELDSQLQEGSFLPDPDLPRQLLNFDHPENVLGALAVSAREFGFRSGARRYFLLMTDDGFLEPPRVFSDGTPARHGYEETATALGAERIRLFSVHAPQRGRGLSGPYQGAPSLVEQTGGAWFEIEDVDGGRLVLDDLLGDLLGGRTCG